MSFERRLAKLETSLSPTEAVLSWLAEAHEFPTLPEYVASLLDAPRDAWPLVRIGDQVEASVRAAMRGKPADAVWKAVRRRVGDAFFLVELAVRLNLAAEEILRFEGLRWALLCQWMRSLTLEAELADRTRRRTSGTGGPSAARVDAWRKGLAVSLSTLYTEEEARTQMERRYLDGRPVLFPALRREWDDLGERIEGLASLPNSLPELRGSGVPGLALGELRGEAAEGAPSRAAELKGPAQAATLDLLGETERAAELVTAWLRPKLEPAAPVLGAAE